MMENSPYDYLDRFRLQPQHNRILNLMSDGQWRTAFQIQEALGLATHSTCLSKLRDIKAAGQRLNTWTYERRKVPHRPGLHEYRLVWREPGQIPLFDLAHA